MGKASFSDNCPCPNCGTLSSSVVSYKTRVLKHYALNEMEMKTYQGVLLRCKNVSCSRKSFIYYPAQNGLQELLGRSRYTQSSKHFISNKMLKHQVSYNSLQVQLQEDFGSSTSVSTLYTWTKQAKLADNVSNIGEINVLHTDEKHPSKKKGQVIKNL